MGTSAAAVLALADGSLFQGTAVGAEGLARGEVVFNTSNTGYQEVATDPSYCRQIVTLTTPHVGNTGTNPEDAEAGAVHLAGLVVRDVPAFWSNWRSREPLSAWLRRHRIVAISGLDTRRLVRHLREHGAQSGCIAAGADASPDEALAGARQFAGLQGLDLAQHVSTRNAFPWTELPWRAPGELTPPPVRGPERVVVYDFGVKRSILRELAARASEVLVVPARTPAAEVLALSPQAVVLSNGPGDPEPCTYAIEAIRALLAAETPLLGICLGHQLLALACGARTVKMKFGHHGANHPVIDLPTSQVWITSQNHGFAVDEASLPAELEATHRSLFDGTLQGLRHRHMLAMSFQGHPEAGPGPADATRLFDIFFEQLRASTRGGAPTATL